MQKDKEWPINTPVGGMLLNIDFFRRIKVNSIRKNKSCDGQILFINIDGGQSISIFEKDWQEIQIELRNQKINKIINE